MRFAYPYLLFLLLLIPLLVGLRLYFQRRQTVQFSRQALLKSLPKSWRIYLQPLMPILYALALLCLIVAMARPQRGLQESLVHTETVDMILLLDLSESMDKQDFIKNRQRISRLAASKEVIERFVSKRPNDRIGMVGFASMPYAISPLTLDHPWLLKRMQGLHTGMLDGRATAIGDGLASAVNRLRESEAKSKIIILLTDGANNFGTLSPENAAQAAAAIGTKIYTIGAGGAYTGPFGSVQEVDEATLQKVADISGGTFYRARDLDSLEAVYAEIDQLEKTKIEMEQFTRFEDMARPWILAGLALLLAEQILTHTKLGRLA
jgi:Ca-activated chloride channel homolog